MKIAHQIHQSSYKAGHSFMGKYQEIVRQTVIPYQYEILNDHIPDIEKSHVVQNYINAGKALRGEDVGDGFYGMVFQDSDAAKWLEAVAYSLSNHPDSKLEDKADPLIQLIKEAQDEDGYLNTYFTIKDREKRWTNLLEAHELYCAGHMMEAACAYYEATGKNTLLKVMEKNAEHIYHHFITEKHEGYPGHPEVELALMRMYHVTKNPHCLELAKHFIDIRGKNPHFFEEEEAKRDWYVWPMIASDTDYNQSSLPLRNMEKITGHAVRAVYLLTGAADLASETDDDSLVKACERLWDNIANTRLYITGGIGSTVQGEAFTVDYDLPSDTAYAETCASIGLIFFGSRMLEMDVDRKYSDVIECALYNTVLAGMQLDGKRFFYVNPLQVVPGINESAVTHKHTLLQRPKWYACACCPPNVARLLSSIGIYAYSENQNTAYCHLYVDGTVTFQNGLQLDCQTEYPYGFTIQWIVQKGSGSVGIRVPSWSKTWSLLQNDAEQAVELKKGYAYIQAKEGDIIKLQLDGTPYYVFASAKVPELNGKTALCRGPLVYCLEGADNQEDILSLTMDVTKTPVVSAFQPNLLNGIICLKAKAFRNRTEGGLYQMVPPREESYTVTAIPYYTWGNRGIHQMRVWMPYYM